MLNFKEWLINLDFKPELSDFEVANLYFHNSNLKVTEIAEKSGRSIGEIYRLLKQYGRPNRQISNHENVIMYAKSGLPAHKIAEFTGYTTRNVRYILKKNKHGSSGE